MVGIKKKILDKIKALVIIFKTVIIFAVIFCVVCILTLVIIYQYNENRIRSNITNIESKIVNLSYYNNSDKVLNCKSDIHCAEGFDIIKNTLPFKNFGTVQSPDGNCKGYSIFEMLCYENKLDTLSINDEKVKSNLGEYHLNSNDKKLLYGKGNIEEFNLIKNENKPDYKKCINKVLNNNSKEENKENLFDINQKMSDNQIDDIVKDIATIQNKSTDELEKEGLYISTESPYYKLLMGYIIKNNKNIVADITNAIDNNNLAVICLSNNIVGGHAILAYAYQKVDMDTFKVYVSDSNFPIVQDNSITIDEYKEHSYMLFKKESGKWIYIYEPSYHGYELYYNYNSYIPENYIQVITTKGNSK